MSVTSAPLQARSAPDTPEHSEGADGGPLKIFWAPRGELDHRAWVAAGRKLGALGRGGQWWVGDWLVYGTFRWGQKYTEAARITGYDTGSLRNMAWLAAQFPAPRRRATLTWCHHAAVAGLAPAEQDRWLDLVSDERLTVADLRLALRAARTHEDRPVAPADEAEQSSGARIICPHCGGEVPLEGAARTPDGVSQ